MSKKEIIEMTKGLAQKDLNLGDKVKAYKDYSGVLENISDNQTKDNKELFEVLRKEMELSSPSDEFTKIAEQVLGDNSKALDKATTEEERNNILDRNMEILKIASEKEKERIENNKEIREKALEKDTENKNFKWGLVKYASYMVIGLVVGGVGTAIGVNKFLDRK